MGLDMYLVAKKYVGGWDHQEDRTAYTKLAELFGVTPDEGSPHFNVEACVGYWRKANAIHRWFVEMVQDGKDECQDSYVSREQLAELRAACVQVLSTVETVDGTLNTGETWYADGRIEKHTKPGQVVAQPSVAASVLPTQGGFFFGNTEYNEYYLEDLRDTVAIIDRALAMDQSWDFEYQSSW